MAEQIDVNRDIVAVKRKRLKHNNNKTKQKLIRHTQDGERCSNGSIRIHVDKPTHSFMQCRRLPSKLQAGRLKLLTIDFDRIGNPRRCRTARTLQTRQICIRSYYLPI